MGFEEILYFVGIGFVIIVGIFAIFMQFYRKVDQGYAMIVNTTRAVPDVTFTGRIVFPILHRREVMNISLKTIEIDRRGSDGLICQDNIRADIKVTFFVRVNKTKEDVLKVAQAIGCERASDPETLDELFSAKFSEALKTVGKQLEFVDLYKERDQFRDEIIRVIGKDLNGYVLEDAAIDYLEQTPLSELDEQNILDAQGIRKITELTATQHILTNNFRRDEETKIKQRDVEAKEKILELERQQADAEAKQQREIATVKAREIAEQKKIEAEELQKSELARILSQQEIEVQEKQKQREVEVADLGKARALAIEEEKVKRVRELEVISREKEVALQEIAKQKSLEEEKKHIADVVRERIAVEKTVAEEEERIKALRVVEEAKRSKEAEVIAAESLAEQELVKELKAAEAAEKTATFKAKERITLAEAARDAAEKEAAAKIQLAEANKEESAAIGLGEVKVMEAKAQAIEKEGKAEALVMREKLSAKAAGEEEIGLAGVRVKEADAASEEKQALVAVKVKVAEAEAIEKQGQAEATVIRERFQAEAEGLRDKIAAMTEMSDNVKEHEEFRMQLDKSHEQSMRAIDANQDIAGIQAKVLAEALKDANIDIVGGDGSFLESFMKSLSVGKAVDGAIGKSDTLQVLASRLLSIGADGKALEPILKVIRSLDRDKVLDDTKQ